MLGDLIRDARWRIGFRRRRRLEAALRKPSPEERKRWDADPRFEPHTDGIEWLGERGGETGRETWLIGERLWHGWPDPPQWAFWALDETGAVVCAADFDDWPSAWRRDEAGDA